MHALLLASLLSAAPDVVVAVLDVQPANPSDAALARALTPALVEGYAAANPRTRVLGLADIKAMLDVTAQQQLLGCVDDRCVAALAATQSSLAVDQILSSTVGVVGDRAALHVSLLLPKENRVLARASTVFDPAASKQVLDAARGSAKATKMETVTLATRTLAASLVGPAAQQAGDQALKELRLAVVVDEYASATAEAPLRARPVQDCLSAALSEKGALLADAGSVAGLRGKATPKQLYENGNTDALGSVDVDVVLVGLVEYADGASGAALLGDAAPKTQRATGNFRLVRVDSGQLVQAVQLEGTGNGLSADKAKVESAKKLCAAGVVDLTAALGKQSARGVDVSVEVAGANAAAVAALAKGLEGKARVTRAVVKRVADKDAVVLVTTDGLDGIALAFALEKDGLVVVSAEATRVKVKVKG